jgi:hypothetical protein
VGKAVNRQAELLSTTVSGDVSFCEITMDITFQNDYRMKMALGGRPLLERRQNRQRAFLLQQNLTRQA